MTPPFIPVTISVCLRCLCKSLMPAWLLLFPVSCALYSTFWNWHFLCMTAGSLILVLSPLYCKTSTALQFRLKFNSLDRLLWQVFSCHLCKGMCTISSLSFLGGGYLGWFGPVKHCTFPIIVFTLQATCLCFAGALSTEWTFSVPQLGE